MFRPALLALIALGATAPSVAAASAVSGHAQLARLFADWRQFNHPTIVRGKPDYSAEAMSAKAKRLPPFRNRLAAINTTAWKASQPRRYRLGEAGMNGPGFFLPVARPG